MNKIEKLFSCSTAWHKNEPLSVDDLTDIYNYEYEDEISDNHVRIYLPIINESDFRYLSDDIGMVRWVASHSDKLFYVINNLIVAIPKKYKQVVGYLHRIN